MLPGAPIRTSARNLILQPEEDRNPAGGHDREDTHHHTPHQHFLGSMAGHVMLELLGTTRPRCWTVGFLLKSGVW